MSLFLRIKPLTCLRVGIKPQQLNSRHICTSEVRQKLNLRLRRVGTYLENQRNLMQKDNVPTGYELIYRAPMEFYVSITKNISTLTATVIAALAAYKLGFEDYMNVPYEVNLTGLVSEKSDLWFFAAGFIAINLAIRLFVAKYPLRIYKNVDKYLAVYDSQIRLRTTQHHFRKGEIEAVRSSLNPWRDSTFRLGDRTSLLLIDYFRTPSEYHQLFIK